MHFDEWWEDNVNERGMYTTANGEWIYENDLKEIWESISAALQPSVVEPVDHPLSDAGQHELYRRSPPEPPSQPAIDKEESNPIHDMGDSNV